MTTCDEIEADKRGATAQPDRAGAVLRDAGRCRNPGRVCGIILELGRPGRRSAQAAFVKPGEARSGSLLLKTDDGYADASRLGIDVDLTVSGPTVRARVTQIFRNPTKDWVEAVYVYPLPAGGAVDTLKMVIGDRVVVGEIKERQQAHDHLRTGQAERTEGRADRTGAAEHLHQLGRQYRPRRNRAGADRISGAGAAIRQRVLAARADGGRAALQSRAASCRASTSSPTAAAGARPNPIRCRTATASRRRVLDPRDQRAGQSDHDHRAAAGRLPARRGEEPSSRDQDRKAPTTARSIIARRRPGAGRPRFRTDLETGGGEGAVGRAVPRARRRQRLSARLRHAAVGRAGAAEAAAARSRSS